AQPAGERAAGRAGSDDDVVEGAPFRHCAAWLARPDKGFMALRSVAISASPSGSAGLRHSPTLRPAMFVAALIEELCAWVRKKRWAGSILCQSATAAVSLPAVTRR